MLELSVHSKSPAAITAALKKIREMVTSGAVEKDAPIHLTLEAGTYHELVRYNLSNPLTIESAPGTAAEDCVVQADNCEAFQRGVENRGVFVLGSKATRVTLKNFSIINTHNRTPRATHPLADAAEALVWNSTDGALRAGRMRIVGRQNTLFVRASSYFKECYICGDTDFIYGEADTAYFEGCTVDVREDSRGDQNGYAIKSLARAGRPGFLFSGCRFTGAARPKGAIYACRTEGRGSATSAAGWDNVAFINCTMEDTYNEELAWDDDRNLNIYPRGNARSGIREYHTLVLGQDGATTGADTTRRNIKCYSLTADDYAHDYASRALILRGTPFATTE